MGRASKKASQAQKQTQPQKQEEAVSQESTASPSVKPINLADGQALKRALDEHASKTLTSRGLEEVFWVSNVKIGLGFLTCMVALLAQFYPGKLPDTWWILAACVSVYGGLTLALNTFSARWEASAFLFLRAAEPVAGCHDLRVSSTMPRFSYTYTLTLETQAPPKHRVSESGSFQVTSFFTEDGYLAEEPWGQEVQRLWHRLCQARSKAQ